MIIDKARGGSGQSYTHLQAQYGEQPLDLTSMADLKDDFESFDQHTTSQLNPKISVHQVIFEGLERTKPGYLETALSGELKKSENLVELSESLNAAFKRLEGLNVFKEVSVLIDKAEDASTSDPESHPVKLVLKCKEKRFNIRTGTELQRRDIAWVRQYIMDSILSL